MKPRKFIVLISVLTLLFIGVFATNSFSWSLFSIFDEKEISDSELDKMRKIDSEHEILFLPQMAGKDFFEACDDLSILREPEVRKYIFLYLTKGRPYVIKAINNSHMYLPEMKGIFSQNSDIHPDMVYLPLLESAFNPRAVSRTKAMGMWQFVRNTAGPLGLKNNKWIDERRDVAKSTDAAVRHIRYLYKELNSWSLVLAAYNGGAGHVQRSMKKTGTNNLWELVNKKSFREETNQFVPRFAALLIIYKHQELFGISDEIKASNVPQVEKVTFENPVSLSEVARITKVDLKTLRKLNPELKRNMTPPYEKNYSLVIPKDKKEELEKNKKKLSYIKFKKLIYYKVKKGDFLGKIARKYKVNLKKIALINNLKKPYLIKPGQVLYIPI